MIQSNFNQKCKKHEGTKYAAIEKFGKRKDIPTSIRKIC